MKNQYGCHYWPYATILKPVSTVTINTIMCLNALLPLVKSLQSKNLEQHCLGQDLSGKIYGR